MYLDLTPLQTSHARCFNGGNPPSGSPVAWLSGNPPAALVHRNALAPLQGERLKTLIFT